MKRFNIAGYQSCVHFRVAKSAIEGLAAIYPNKFAANIVEHANRDEFQAWLGEFRGSVGLPNHKSSPLVWFDNNEAVGGRDDTIKLIRKILTLGDDAVDDEKESAEAAAADVWNAEHGFEYDLVVIGGGSGGLATGREAAKLGAKVAILDFVKPSPAGSKWGLGGTCVNVGCIPKKLMHNAALIGEHKEAGSFYGWGDANNKGSHDWDTLRQNVQDHIKGLNFGYRVALREEGITYHNKLGRFVGPNELLCVDNKGKESTITGARFVVAVGGRPTNLSCPGNEHAITSDDLFMKKTPPGKTCVVGAGYVALECAGFLTGLKQGDVTVLVRSIMLRGFDREIVGRVKDIMLHNGTNIKEGVTPQSIEKLETGKLKVTFSNGDSDEFDTVLAAVGRYMDVDQLGVGADSKVPLQFDPKGKLLCKNEQTSIPHIYAVGDIVSGAPELTPVAIAAGRLLSRRLFGGGSELMKYKDVATTVFTPLELGTIGLTEEEALDKYGEGAVDIYHRAFQPLEWTIIEDLAEIRCLAKVIVEVETNKVLGMHIAAPNAGEIMQGFGVAFRKGITHKDLLDTVGIHPCTAEEFVDLEISKSSGEAFEKKGC